MDEYYEDLKEDLRKKEDALRTYGSIERAPIPLLVSMRILMKRIAYAKRNKNIINDEQLYRALEEADARFSSMLKPEGGNRYLVESDDRKEILEQVKRGFIEFKELSHKYRSDREIAMAAVKNNGYNLYYVSEELTDDKELVLLAVKYDGECLSFASDRLRDDYDVVKAALNSDNYNRRPFDLYPVSLRLRDNKEIIMAAVKKKGENLRYASDRLKDDKEVVLAAIKNGGSAIGISKRLKNDEDVAMAAIDNGESLSHFENKISDNRDIVMHAVKKHGFDLVHASERLKDDIEVVKEAIKQNPKAIEFASDRVKKEIEKERVQATYVNNSILTDEDKTMRFISSAFKMNVISTKIDYSIPKTYSEIPKDMFKKMQEIDDMFQRDMISYEFAIELIASLFERDGVKRQFEQYVDDVLFQKIKQFYETIERIYQDLLFALNTGKITKDDFIKEFSKMREKETVTIWSILSKVETFHKHQR